MNWENCRQLCSRWIVNRWIRSIIILGDQIIGRGWFDVVHISPMKQNPEVWCDSHCCYTISSFWLSIDTCSLNHRQCARVWTFPAFGCRLILIPLVIEMGFQLTHSNVDDSFYLSVKFRTLCGHPNYNEFFVFNLIVN